MSAHPYARSVADALRRAGHRGVTLEHRVTKELWRPRGKPYITFDISYLALTARHALRLLILGEAPRDYVECKYRTTKPVDERDVAKFLEDLHLCAIPYQHGLIITNHGYTPLAIDFAQKRGVRLYTGPHRRWPNPFKKIT